MAGRYVEPDLWTIYVFSILKGKESEKDDAIGYIKEELKRLGICMKVADGDSELPYERKKIQSEAEDYLKKKDRLVLEDLIKRPFYRVVITGRVQYTSRDLIWGAGREGYCWLRMVEKTPVWHEVGHLLGLEFGSGAEGNCKNAGCLMQYAGGRDFCRDCLRDVKKHWRRRKGLIERIEGVEKELKKQIRERRTPKDTERGLLHTLFELKRDSVNWRPHNRSTIEEYFELFGEWFETDDPETVRLGVARDEEETLNLLKKPTSCEEIAQKVGWSALYDFLCQLEGLSCKLGDGTGGAAMSDYILLRLEEMQSEVEGMEKVLKEGGTGLSKKEKGEFKEAFKDEKTELEAKVEEVEKLRGEIDSLLDRMRSICGKHAPQGRWQTDESRKMSIITNRYVEFRRDLLQPEVEAMEAMLKGKGKGLAKDDKDAFKAAKRELEVKAADLQKLPGEIDTHLKKMRYMRDTYAPKGRYQVDKDHAVTPHHHVDVFGPLEHNKD